MFNEHLTPSIIIRWSRFQVNHGLRSDCCFSLNSARSHPPAYNNLKILLFLRPFMLKMLSLGVSLMQGIMFGHAFFTVSKPRGLLYGVV